MLPISPQQLGRRRSARFADYGRAASQPVLRSLQLYPHCVLEWSRIAHVTWLDKRQLRSAATPTAVKSLQTSSLLRVWMGVNSLYERDRTENNEF
jgi:hypothetical protein